jgi:hypothetical protein
VVGFISVPASTEPSRPLSHEPHHSAFGFGFALDRSWRQLDPRGVPRTPEALAADPRFAGVNPTAFLAALAKVEAGQYEFYFRAYSPTFAENLAISRGVATVPSDETEVRKRCAELPALLSSKYGREVKPARCELRRVEERVANSIEVEGPIPGTWNFQAQIQSTDGRAVMILATISQQNLESFRLEFDALLASLRFDAPTSAPAPSE